MVKLNSTDEVIEALGGIRAVMDLTDSSYKVVWHWKGAAKAFPPKTYLVMTAALRRAGCEAAPRLWNMAALDKVSSS